MFNDHTEWMLYPKIFNKISTLWGPFDIDIFASRLNKQWPKYVAWKPDPNSEFIDAFSVNLSKFYFYAFPPWYTSLLELLVDVPRKIRKDQGWLKLPHSEKKQSMKMTLTGCGVSGQIPRTGNFARRITDYERIVERIN